MGSRDLPTSASQMLRLHVHTTALYLRRREFKGDCTPLHSRACSGDKAARVPVKEFHLRGLREADSHKDNQYQ
jgi:hypothetical protein